MVIAVSQVSKKTWASAWRIYPTPQDAGISQYSSAIRGDDTEPPFILLGFAVLALV